MFSVKTQIGEGGRVIVPASIRRQLHWSIGDDVILTVDGNNVSITNADHALQMLQARVKSFRQSQSSDVNLLNDLIESRRLESQNE